MRSVCLAFLAFCFLSTSFANGQQPQQLQVAITIDDLPEHGDLPPGLTRLDVARSMLGTLKRENLPPVYGFINAQQADEEPADAKVLAAWRAAGEPLGNHTWSHPSLDQTPLADYEADALKNETTLRRNMAGEPDASWKWFRFPFLEEGDTLSKRRAFRSWLAQHGYQVAEVSIDFEDYLWNDPYARCMVKHDDAAIQRLHDTYLQAANQYITIFRTLSHQVFRRDIRYVLLLHIGAFDARMLPELIELLRKRGFSFVTLPEAMADPVYAKNPDFALKGGGAFQEIFMDKRHLKYPAGAKPVKMLEHICR